MGTENLSLHRTWQKQDALHKNNLYVYANTINIKKTTAISKISRIFVVNYTLMAKFYQDISASGGTIRTHELREPRAYYGINKGIKSGDIIRIKNGVYMLTEELATTMIDVERIVPGGVVCMYSAWEYYGLTTQIPDGFYIAIEKHRKVVVPEITGIVLCYWEEKYCTMGVEEAEIANHKVKIFCIEKSVCDAVKFRNKIGINVAVEILKNYLDHRDHNVSLLMDFARQMRIKSTMNQYLDAILN